MRVLLLTQYFPPEIGATQNRMAEFAAALAAAGHDVEVLTEVPNHPSGIVAPAYRTRWIYRDEERGYRVTRVWVFARPRKTFLTRAGFYSTFFFMAVLACLAGRQRYDVVVATTPPLTVAAAGLALSRLKRAPFVVDVRDLWPEAAAALGELSNPVLYRAAERLEHAIYRGARAITATTEGFCAAIAAHGAAAAVTHVPNGTRPDLFASRAEGRDAFRRRHDLGDRFVVAYIGLHGIAQGLEVVLDAAPSAPEALFLLVGEGPRKPALMAECARRGCRNVRFFDEVPSAGVADVMAAADVLLVTLSAAPVFRTFVPSKLFDAMAAARPIVLMVDGEARGILESAGAGVFVPPGDAAGLAAAVMALERDPAARGRMGAAGRAFVTARYDRRRQAARFAEIVAAAGGAS
ncbi:MAG TPA: glycosyltransferase family 4 protein [Vicinamibacterales bacterium]|nr:glycosyltransferase family 4 protein [Vicinamibacterales bacterium]